MARQSDGEVTEMGKEMGNRQRDRGRGRGSASGRIRAGLLLVAMVSVLFSAIFVALPALAVQPDEMLDDPVLEARAREISRDIRCLVCRNESIDDSNADLARDLRLLVRERVTAGDSNAEVKNYLVARYGEFVLLMPRFSAANAALYAFPALAFLIGLMIVVIYLRHRGRAAPKGQGAADAPLSEQERQQLDRILER